MIALNANAGGGFMRLRAKWTKLAASTVTTIGT